MTLYEELTSDRHLILYTDGSCVKNGTDEARASYGVYISENSPNNESGLLPVGYRQSNNSAEIYAAARGLIIAKQLNYTAVEIRTDSEFLINCINNRLPFWLTNNWQTAGKKNVRNRSELEYFLKCSKGLQVRFKHIKGHSGVEGNEMADTLTRMAGLR